MKIRFRWATAPERWRLCRNGLRLTVCLVLLIAACAMNAPKEAVPVAKSRVNLAQLSVEDEHGPLDPERAAAAVRRLDKEGEDGLLALHLAEVQDVIATPLVLGNDARLLIDGPQTQEAMLRAIGEARSSINLETYILESAGMGERLAAILEAKRAKGVRARVLYDSVGSLGTSAEYFDRLRSAGVEVCEFNPVNPLRLQYDRDLNINNRDHRKILIVDDQVAFTGGINISGVYSSSSFGRKRKVQDPDSGWRDTHVEVHGPVVSQFRSLFDGVWRKQGCAESPEPAAHASPARSGNMAIRLVAADPVGPRSELYAALLSAVEHAKSRIWLTYGYFVPDERVLLRLQEAAARGVDVRLMLPGFSDFWAPFYAGRSHYSRLLRAGVHIFERRDALLHAKTAVIDGVWSSVGSTNLDWRSFVHNYEADVLVLNSRFGAEMEHLFHLDESAAHEIVLSEWNNRGLRNRMLELLARPWSYLL